MNEQHEDQGSQATGLCAASCRGETSVRQQSKEPFAPDRSDVIFALLAFGLGFFFVRWVLLANGGWGVTLFTLGYGAVVLVYLFNKGVAITREGWFWLAIMVLTGLSYSLWTGCGLEPWRGLLLFCSAVYWVVSAAGVALRGETSDWIILDGLNGLLGIPFRNFSCQYRSLAYLGRNKRSASKQIIAVALGLFLTAIIAAMVLPLLLQADSGGFSKITHGLFIFLQGLSEDFGQYLGNGLLAVPVAAYIFALVAGSAHKRNTTLFTEDSSIKALGTLRVLPMATVYTILGLLCSLYILFIGSQVPYFFSAFVGQRPEGWQVYSEYARSGFFELCRIAAINLSVLTIANFMSIKPFRASKALQILNALLAVLTVVLIFTALSKMAMYIGAYGLSMRRLLPCFFMVFLAVVYGGVVAMQKWQFSIARLAVGAGVVMLCLLCLVNPDGYVANYNANRYLAGTLSEFDQTISYISGPAGVDAAVKVYTQTADPALRVELEQYIRIQQEQAAGYSGQHQDNWERAKARQTGGHI